MLTNLSYILILLLGFPAGLILANICREEVKSWRKRLIILSVICLFLSISLIFINYQYKIPIIISLIFIIITSLTIVLKSYKKTNLF